jgi:threonine/homoserine/homoserine lactone efflux protein
MKKKLTISSLIFLALITFGTFYLVYWAIGVLPKEFELGEDEGDSDDLF